MDPKRSPEDSSINVHPADDFQEKPVQVDGRRPSSMSPILRARRHSLDNSAAVVLSPDQLKQEENVVASKEV